MKREWEQIQKEYCDRCIHEDEESIFPSFECSYCTKIKPGNKNSVDNFIPRSKPNE